MCPAPAGVASWQCGAGTLFAFDVWLGKRKRATSSTSTDRQAIPPTDTYIECTVGGNPSACANLTSLPLPPTTAHPISPPLRLEHDGRLSDLRSPLSALRGPSKELKVLGSLVAASSSSSRALLLVLTLAAFGHFHLLRVSRKPIKMHVLPEYHHALSLTF